MRWDEMSRVMADQLSEEDVAGDGVVGDTGVGVDVADRLDADGAGDVLDSLGGRRQTRRPRQLLTQRQQRLTEHAACIRDASHV